MTKDSSIVINADTARRIALNRERNPVQAQTTTYEGTDADFSLNPITGLPYNHRHLSNYDTSVLEALWIEQLKEMQHEIQATNTLNPISNTPYLPGEEGKPKRFMLPIESSFAVHFFDDTELFELHRALGRMDVRDGKLSRSEYNKFKGDLNNLALTYNQSNGLTLDSITTPEGMNLALKKQSEQRECDRLRDFLFMKKGLSDSGYERTHGDKNAMFYNILNEKKIEKINHFTEDSLRENPLPFKDPLRKNISILKEPLRKNISILKEPLREKSSIK